VLQDNSVSKSYETAAEKSDEHSFRNPSSRGELKAAASAEISYDCNCAGRCTCPETCICKKSGYCGHTKAAAHEGAPWDTPVDKLPWRERVEVYARDPKGKIYGGIWNTDKSFAVPGGGIDPGEDPGQAAIRELEEETGIKAINPRVLPIPPVDNAWSEKHRQEKQRNFAGSRTHFVAVDILKKLRKKELDKWDAVKRKMYDPAAAADMMANHKNFMAPTVAAGRLAALRHLIATAANKTAADLLPGGAADNMPDSKFPKIELATGVADEHEHTNNDQIAKEIAKDHLQEDPAYYKKEKVVKQPSILDKLREAKQHSDAKRYAQKNNILHALMTGAPHDWVVDDPLPYHMGVTHNPTKFRFHADPAIIPVGVKVQAKAAAANPYLSQLVNMNQPILVDKTKSLWRHFFNQLRRVKERGDEQVRMQQNDHAWRSALVPGYRQQANLALARGEFPQPNATTQFINRHGDSILSMLPE
jgi:8-oxo-dGTP pyrophosphatase MutT (NUDIX family)